MTLKLPAAGDDRWHLPQHAHVVVYEAADGRELVTIYDCGAAQKPPSARVIGHLDRVAAAHEMRRSPTGYVVKLRESSELLRLDDENWRIES